MAENNLHVFGNLASVGTVQAIFEGKENGWGAGIQLSSRTSAGGTLVPMAKIVADGADAWNTTVATQDSTLGLWVSLDGVLTESLRLRATGGVFSGGLSVGHTGVPVADIVSVGDASFSMEGISADPRINFDSGLDMLRFVRGTNTFEWHIGSASKLSLNASGLQIPDGLVVGFSGTPVADEVQVGDANFKLHWVSSSETRCQFDSGDYLVFGRAANLLNVFFADTQMSYFTTGEFALIAAHINMQEIADPVAPAVNEGRLYMKDNGAGKTQFVVRFNTGAVQVVATQP